MTKILTCFLVIGLALVSGVSRGDASDPWGESGFQIGTTDEDSIGPECVARVKAAYLERGTALKELTDWGWWLKTQTADTLVIGKRRLPTDTNGLFPSDPYRAILDSLGGTDGYALVRDATDPHVVYLFGARDAGTSAGTDDFLANGYTVDKIVRTGAPERDEDRWTDEGRLPLSHTGVVFQATASSETVFPPSCWSIDRNGEGTTLAVKTGENDAEYLEVVQEATATNTCRIKTYVGETCHFTEPIAIPRYGAAVFEIEADGDWSGGQLVFVGPNWKGGGSVPVGEGYEKPCHSWNFQRTALIGSFHTGEDQVLALQANPRRAVPANLRVTLTNALSLAWLNAAPTRTASIVNFDLPVNTSGVRRVIRIHTVKFIENVADNRYLDQAKAFDAKLAAYEPDYSDSTHFAEVPATHRLAQPFSVVTNGAAAASVALPEGGISTCLETAAEEFVKYVKEITGVTLPTVRLSASAVTAPDPAVTNVLFLGFGSFAGANGKDGYRISSANGNLLIDGGNDKGVLNGVYALLENNTDIIWAHPDETYGTIFTASPGELTFLWGDGYEAVPETPGRGWNGYLMLEWMAHNQCDIYNCGGGGDITWMNAKKSKYGVLYTRHFGGHNIFQFMAGAPEDSPVGYYACNEDGVRTGGNPCFSSQALLDLFVTNVLSALRYAPDDTDELYINLQDTWKSCLCKNCRAPIVFANGVRVEPTDENFFSTRYFLFMNKVAEAVRREFPTKRITTLAYFGSLPAPSCKLHPNLTPEFAPYPRNNAQTPLYHPDNRLHLQHLDDWFDLVGPDRLEVYGYHGIGLGFPRPISETAVEDFKLFNTRTIGISSEFHERNSTDEWDYSAIEYWTMTRLMWDTTQDVEQLRKRFIRRAFREAAAPMERFYGTIRREYCSAPRQAATSTSLSAGSYDLIVKPCHVRELRSYLDEAQTLATHAKSQEMISRISTQFEAGVASAKAAALSDVDEILNRLREADPGEVVKVAPGTYRLSEPLTLTNSITLQSTGSRDNTFFEPAVGYNGRLAYLQATSTAAADRPILEGVTLRNACVTNIAGSLAYVGYPGGVIRDCRFTGSRIYGGYSENSGGAVFMHPGGSLLRSIVDHNASEQVTLDNGKVKPTAGVLMAENSGLAKNIGGCNIENCLIVQNDGPAVYYGFITYYNPAIRNCTIVDNCGYGAVTSGRESEYYNNIFLVTSNRGLRSQATYPPGRNTTHYKNNFQINNPVASAASNVSHENNVLGWDAMFVNPGAMDYHLKAASPCIDRGRAFDGTGTTDLDGKARTSGDATDIGCYEYDPDYVGKNPTLYVSYEAGSDSNEGTNRVTALKTVTHAYDIAEEGTAITLLEGHHPIAKTLTLAKPIRIVGEKGRDKTFLELADGATPVTLVDTQHILAEVRDITICRNSTLLVSQTRGGLIEHCRITGFTNTVDKVSPIAWYGEWGTLYRTVVDRNFSGVNQISAKFLEISGRKDYNCVRGGIVDTCLIAENDCYFYGGAGKTASGGVINLTRNGGATGSPSSLVNSTILSNDTSGCVNVTRFASSVRNNIILHRGSGSAMSVENDTAGSVCVSNCTPVIPAKGSGVTELPHLYEHGVRKYAPKADASAVGMAQPYNFAADDLDLAGNPRLHRDGTQDIGCYQYVRRPTLILVR